MKYLLSFVPLLFVMQLHSQADLQPFMCGNDLFSQSVREYHPALYDAFNQTFDMAKEARHPMRRDEALHVQVVVHVVWKHAAENLHDSIIHDQIRILNEDFNRINADTGNLRDIFKSVAAGANVHFELAAIERVQTTEDFSISLLSTNLLQEVKSTTSGGSDGWDTESYLNIWVCKIQPLTILGFEIGQILGFAFPPNGLEHWPADVGAPSPDQDGVVVDYRVFGSNNPNTINIPGGTGETLTVQGRTPVHEVGHYLGLRHIWGDGGLLGPNDCDQSDGVDDTPYANAQSPFNCDHSRNTCTRIETYYNADMPDLIENYMDYAREDCMNMFTRGQVEIMRNVLLGPRSGLLSPASSVQGMHEAGNILVYPNPARGQVTIVVANASEVIRSVRILSFDGIVKHRAVYNSAGDGVHQILIDTGGLSAGVYLLQIETGTRVVHTRLVITE